MFLPLQIIHYLSAGIAKIATKRQKTVHFMLFMIRRMLYFPKNQRRGILLFILVIAATILIIAAAG